MGGNDSKPVRQWDCNEPLPAHVSARHTSTSSSYDRDRATWAWIQESGPRSQKSATEAQTSLSTSETIATSRSASHETTSKSTVRTNEARTEPSCTFKAPSSTSYSSSTYAQSSATCNMNEPGLNIPTSRPLQSAAASKPIESRNTATTSFPSTADDRRKLPGNAPHGNTCAVGRTKKPVAPKIPTMASSGANITAQVHPFSTVSLTVGRSMPKNEPRVTFEVDTTATVASKKSTTAPSGPQISSNRKPFVSNYNAHSTTEKKHEVPPAPSSKYCNRNTDRDTAPSSSCPKPIPSIMSITTQKPTSCVGHSNTTNDIDVSRGDSQLFSMGASSSSGTANISSRPHHHQRHIDVKVYTPLQSASEVSISVIGSNNGRGNRGTCNRGNRSRGHRGARENSRTFHRGGGGHVTANESAEDSSVRKSQHQLGHDESNRGRGAHRARSHRGRGPRRGRGGRQGRGGRFANADSEQADTQSPNKSYECPICMEDLQPPIYQCHNGHLVCANCEKQIDKCAECRDDMPGTKIRNRAIEDLVTSLANLRP